MESASPWPGATSCRAITSMSRLSTSVVKAVMSARPFRRFAERIRSLCPKHLLGSGSWRRSPTAPSAYPRASDDGRPVLSTFRRASGEEVPPHDGLVSPGPHRDERRRNLDELLDALDVAASVLRAGPRSAAPGSRPRPSRASSRRWARRARPRLIVIGKSSVSLPSTLYAVATMDLGEAAQDVELVDREVGDAIHADRFPKHHDVEPAAATRAFRWSRRTRSRPFSAPHPWRRRARWERGPPPPASCTPW